MTDTLEENLLVSNIEQSRDRAQLVTVLQKRYKSVREILRQALYGNRESPCRTTHPQVMRQAYPARDISAFR